MDVTPLKTRLSVLCWKLRTWFIMRFLGPRKQSDYEWYLQWINEIKADHCVDVCDAYGTPRIPKKAPSRGVVVDKAGPWVKIKGCAHDEDSSEITWIYCWVHNMNCYLTLIM